MYELKISDEGVRVWWAGWGEVGVVASGGK